MTDPLSIIEDAKTYIHHMIQSVIEEKRAIAAARRINRCNNEVNINDAKLSQAIDCLDEKLENYAAHRRLLDELENAINLAKKTKKRQTNDRPATASQKI